MLEGISVVICCYNSAQRLPETLRHLAAQDHTDDILWEVVVIDNASTDETAHIAAELWSRRNSIPLRVIHEPQQGLSYARRRGFLEATYPLVSFIDDDNWVSPEWVKTVAEIMSAHPDVGACGGASEAMPEISPPSWFDYCQDAYAVGQQAERSADVTWTRGFLWGAGLSIRKQAWQQLIDKGFLPLLSDRQGSSLASCGDYELCLALRLMGWRLWYEPNLKFYHYIPATRLTWSYIRRLKRGFGAGSAGLDPYFFLQKTNYLGISKRLQGLWVIRFSIVLAKLLRYPHLLILSLFYPLEGNLNLLSVEILLGRLSELWRRRKFYGRQAQTVLTVCGTSSNSLKQANSLKQV
jgi:glycosyltransferase involved in cell wall biosynthesis